MRDQRKTACNQMAEASVDETYSECSTVLQCSLTSICRWPRHIGGCAVRLSCIDDTNISPRGTSISRAKRKIQNDNRKWNLRAACLISRQMSTWEQLKAPKEDSIIYNGVHNIDTDIRRACTEGARQSCQSRNNADVVIREHGA